MVNHPNRSKQQQPTHTPGPWYQTGDTIREQASDAVICTISDGGHVTQRVISQATAEANARLIAAAPELLAALKAALPALSYKHGDPLAERVRAAIAKCEGR